MANEIKFIVESADLAHALSVLSIVPPQAVGVGGGGYLFVVRGELCAVYSRDGKHEARSSFPVRDVTGEGMFMLPSECAPALGFVKGPIGFVASEDGGAFKVRYSFGASGVSEHVTFDPRTMALFEKDIAKAKENTPTKFQIEVLRYALGFAKSYLPKPNDPVDQEQYRTIKVFGNADPELAKKANGYLLASNGREIGYFHCSAFVDQDLTLPSQHIGAVEAFLRASDGGVEVYATDTKAYVINGKGDVFGWPKHATEYKRFSYYAKQDEVVAQVSPELISHQLKYMKATLGKQKTKIKLHFSPEEQAFHFSSVDESNNTRSLPVPVESLETKVTSEVVVNVNVAHMLHMFDGVTGDRVEFRIKVIPADANRPKDRFMFRTIDEFLLNDEGEVVGGLVDNAPAEAHRCTVTRFCPSID